METVDISSEITINSAKDNQISQNDASSLYIEQPLSQQSQEVSLNSIKTDTSMNCMPTTGIEANDIGSLFEQFLEYEQGSEADISSYPDSFLTPAGSPGECNEDVVLGRLMIVQEKLSQEVASVPSNDDNKGEDNNNYSGIKADGLLRTVNGVHPKGNNIRMADSPKFAKFKKKKLSSDPPLRRCVSGPSTPRCTSPSDIVSPEETKRREVKLIEALALTIPKQNNKSEHKKTEADKAKRNLSVQKQAFEDHIPSRLMPVVPKRKRLEQIENVIESRLSVGKVSADPRLNKLSYGEKSNITHLKNTQLVEVNSSTTTDNDTMIVDMTIDHETLAGSMLTVPHTKLKNETSKLTEVVPNSVHETNESEVEVTNISNSDNTIESANDNTMNSVKPKSSIVKPPKNYRRVNNLVEPETDDLKKVKRKRIHSPTSRKKHSRSKEVSPLRERSRSPLSDHERPSKNLSHSPKSHSISGSRSGCSSRRSSISPIRSQSRDSSRATSRSPSYYRSSGRAKSPESKSHCGSKRNRHSSSGGSESLDISSKLSELSHPVPYDIEHERKLRFLCGGASGGSLERRNIYVGGIADGTSRVDLDERFRRFGNIEKITLHFRDKGDNYAFIVFDEPENAMRAIEEGNDDPEYPPLELCFGGRRTFVGGSYVDFDGNNEYLEEKETTSRNRCDSPEDDFDQLLKMAMRGTKKKETTPEWT